MKLYRHAPTKVAALGRRFCMRTDFRQVLHALDVLADEGLYVSVRTEAALRLLVRGRLPRGDEARAQLLYALRVVLFDSTASSGKHVLDYAQDAGLIRAAFWQAYQLDLTRTKLHWFLFRDLLAALPEDTLLSRVMGWRAADIPPMTKHNRDQVQQLLRLKSLYALRGHEDRTLQQGLSALFELMCQQGNSPPREGEDVRAEAERQGAGADLLAESGNSYHYQQQRR
ncbi:MAG: Gp15 family bacteriophage protein, partial [Clostridia bacterium]